MNFSASTHASDLPFIFGKGPYCKFKMTKNDKEVTENVLTFYTNFAKYGFVICDIGSSFNILNNKETFFGCHLSVTWKIANKSRKNSVNTNWLNETSTILVCFIGLSLHNKVSLEKIISLGCLLLLRTEKKNYVTRLQQSIEF